MSNQKLSFKLPSRLERSIDEVDKSLAQGSTELDLDFSATTFITVEGLQWLEELLLRGQSKQAKINFVNCAPEVYKVFKVAHIGSLLAACGGPPVSGPAC